MPLLQKHTVQYFIISTWCHDAITHFSLPLIQHWNTQWAPHSQNGCQRFWLSRSNLNLNDLEYDATQCMTNSTSHTLKWVRTNSKYFYNNVWHETPKTLWHRGHLWRVYRELSPESAASPLSLQSSTALSSTLCFLVHLPAPSDLIAQFSATPPSCLFKRTCTFYD